MTAIQFKKSIFFYLTFLFSFLAGAEELKLPYEECHWANREYTENMLKQVRGALSPATTEAAACSHCSRLEPIEHKPSSSLGDVSVKQAAEQASYIPDMCFLASMFNTKEPGKNNFYYCQGGGKWLSKTMNFHSCENVRAGLGCSLGLARDQQEGSSRDIHPRKYCLNQEYVQMTAKAFRQTSDCFDFSPKEQRDLFTMLNHESGFALNARSSTHARCYGQITMDVFHAVNRYVHYKDKEKAWRSQSGIYEDVMKKSECSFLGDKMVRLPFEQGYKGSVDNYDKKFNDEFSNNWSRMTCPATRDPYTCLFYSMYFYKLQQHLFFSEYHEIPKDIGLWDREKYGSSAGDFYAPIRLNEIVIVKGKITKTNGEEVYVEWLIDSDHELKKILDTKFTYNRDDLRIQKINVYDEDGGDLFRDVTQISYNGGRKIIKGYFPEYMNNLKRQVAKKETCERQAACASLREHILAGRVFSVRDFNNGFSDYLKKIDEKTPLNGEPEKFNAGIIEDLCYLTDKGNKKGQLRAKLQNYRYGRDLSQAEIVEFIDQVKNLCPGNDIPPEYCK